MSVCPSGRMVKEGNRLSNSVTQTEGPCSITGTGKFNLYYQFSRKNDYQLYKGEVKDLVIILTMILLAGDNEDDRLCGKQITNISQWYSQSGEPRSVRL